MSRFDRAAVAVTNNAELDTNSTSADATRSGGANASSSGESAPAAMKLAPVPLPLPGLADAITAMLTAKLAFRASLEVVRTSHDMLASVVDLAEYGVTPD